MSLARKVARRYIFARIFDPPPELLSDVTSFLQSKYAGHVLAKTQKRIDQMQSGSSKSVEERRQGLYDEIDRFKEYVSSIMEEGDREHFKLNPMENRGLLVRKVTDREFE